MVSAVERPDLRGIDIKPDDSDTAVVQRRGERQAHIPEPDYTNNRGAAFDAFAELSDVVVQDVRLSLKRPEGVNDPIRVDVERELLDHTIPAPGAETRPRLGVCQKLFEHIGERPRVPARYKPAAFAVLDKLTDRGQIS